MKVKPEIRRHALLEALQSEKFHQVENLLDKFEVSKATLHRDLDILEKNGHIKKSYGCIETLSNSTVEIEYAKRLNRNSEEKKAIAEAACRLISPGDIIFIDASSTCFYLAEIISRKLPEDLTMISNSVHVLSLLKQLGDKVKIISTGGKFDHRLNAFIGNLTQDFLEKMTFRKMFVSGAGFSINKGLTTTNDWLLGVIEVAMKNSRKRYCLVDSSKYGRDCLIKVAELKSFDAVISGDKYSKDDKKQFKEHQINLLTG